MVASRYERFTAQFLCDALKIVGECFNGGADNQVRKALTNPALKAGEPSGEIGYQNDEPVCFQAIYPKTLYIGTRPIKGHTAGCLSLRKGFSAGYLVEVITRSIYSQEGSMLYFGNTAMKTAAKMQILKGAQRGPNTFSYETFGIVNWLRATWYFACRKVLKREVRALDDHILNFNYSQVVAGQKIERLNSFKDARIDDFWCRYIANNHGLVSSRTSIELNWVFGDDLQAGRCVALALVASGGDILGYIVVAPSESYGIGRWYIKDLIALNNDKSYLKMLLGGAIRFLRSHTPCYILSVRGLPPWVHDLFAFFFKHKQMYNCNKSIYKILDESLVPLLGDFWGEQNWFWGPYDGDYTYN